MSRAGDAKEQKRAAGHGLGAQVCDERYAGPIRANINNGGARTRRAADTMPCQTIRQDRYQEELLCGSEYLELVTRECAEDKLPLFKKKLKGLAS
jgi:hypothetical protein